MAYIEEQMITTSAGMAAPNPFWQLTARISV
jgi:hypothetical protein